jgi:hypothetical protein
VRQSTYPLLARDMRARRDNLLTTITVLEERASSDVGGAVKSRGRAYG